MAIVGNRPTYGVMPDVESGNPLVKMLEPMIEYGPKQGHSFCGCCCDMRRATIVINIIVLILNLLFVSSVYFTLDFAFSDDMKDLIEDDEVKGQIEAFNFPATCTVLLILLLTPGCLCSLAAISGAVRYKACPIIVNIVYLTALFFWPFAITVDEDATGAAIKILLIYGFFMYPHVMLVYEIIGSKTMSQQTYFREERSLC